MDFLNRSNAQAPASRTSTPTPAPLAAAPTPQQPHNDKASFKNPLSWAQPGWLRVIFVVLLFSAVGLAIACVVLVNRGGISNENTYINKKQYQAVFLTNGQVYFGKVSQITKSYIDLQDIYYLNSQQSTTDTKTTTTTPSSFSLVKLGCELHGPNDQMLINRDQVTFWENLKTDRQVAKAIAQWQQQNPSGQKCQDTAASTQQPTDPQPLTQNPASTQTTKKP